MRTSFDVETRGRDTESTRVVERTSRGPEPDHEGGTPPLVRTVEAGEGSVYEL